ncbi:unnamed protein product (macronuclear) [Paramecium tetraurelia]|uniref:Transmembrane protein n=1 Tax=Paramecium tetraurelia TaxID=5888 RepID=A0BRB7_PARTE|nr:uncharacterized protein GSPATT00031315001 [Paramecium tetraurelia]CAK61084.1 unnamed protein product [Paramecium tetraurelia]|eukprot:XP_001428482.1 hypothetical protein (macronuclear) [Paramecium tetraurelia strain d4-2]
MIICFSPFEVSYQFSLTQVIVLFSKNNSYFLHNHKRETKLLFQIFLKDNLFNFQKVTIIHSNLPKIFWQINILPIYHNFESIRQFQSSKMEKIIQLLHNEIINHHQNINFYSCKYSKFMEYNVKILLLLELIQDYFQCFDRYCFILNQYPIHLYSVFLKVFQKTKVDLIINFRQLNFKINFIFFQDIPDFIQYLFCFITLFFKILIIIKKCFCFEINLIVTFIQLRSLFIQTIIYEVSYISSK